jgi:branched-chain amino acid aminotransferase
MIGFFKNKFVDESEMLLPIRSKAIQYGLGTFEGIRAYWNDEEEQLYIFRAADHFQRLHESCKIFRLKPEYTVEKLVELCVELLKKNHLKSNTYIRPLFYHNSVKMAPVFEDGDTEFSMYCNPLEAYIDTSKGIDVCISSWQRVPDNAIPSRAKPTGLYLNSALVRDEAYKNGYQEGIFLTTSGKISEGSGEHLFMIKDGVVFSPPSTEDNLDGITRKTIITLIENETNYPVVERSIARSELYTCDELFFVGTGAEVTSIKSVDRRDVGTGEFGVITKELQTIYFNAVKGKNKKYSDWLTPVY